MGDAVHAEPQNRRTPNAESRRGKPVAGLTFCVLHSLFDILRFRRPTALDLLVPLLFALASCRPAAPPPAAAPAVRLDPAALTGERAFAEVRDFVAVGPRPAGSDGAAAAAGHIVTRLFATGLPDTAIEVDDFRDRTPDGEQRFRNVLGAIEGTGTGTVILASHYDTAATVSTNFTGANDSGSSTGLLLALAEAFQRGPRLPVTLVFAFLDGEECRRSYGPQDGLHGSRHLVRQLRAQGRLSGVRAFILLDMVGDRDLTITLPRNSSPELATLAFDAARAEDARHRFTLHDAAVLDDHVPFLEAGVPAVDLIDFEFGSAPGRNDYWHTSEDTLDKLSPESLQTVGRVVIRMVNSLSAER
jgi:glutaminyl-peptide cyclotransferase